MNLGGTAEIYDLHCATEYRNGNCCDADKRNGRNEKNALRMCRIP